MEEALSPSNQVSLLAFDWCDDSVINWARKEFVKGLDLERISIFCEVALEDSSGCADAEVLIQQNQDTLEHIHLNRHLDRMFGCLILSCTNFQML